MPIIFRCRHCNQRMGIARRKAGTEVECPSCKGKVTVPEQSDEGPALPVQAPSAAPLFEDSNFDDFLNPPQHGEQVLIRSPQAVPRGATPRPMKPPSPLEFEPRSDTTAARRDSDLPGLVFSPFRLLLATVAIILALALAFSAGLVVGIHL